MILKKVNWYKIELTFSVDVIIPSNRYAKKWNRWRKKKRDAQF